MTLEKQIFKSFSKLLIIFGVITLIVMNIVMVIYMQIYGKLDLYSSATTFNEYMADKTAEDNTDASTFLSNINIIPTTKIIVVDEEKVFYGDEFTYLNDEIIEKMFDTNSFSGITINNTFIYDSYYYHYVEMESAQGIVKGQVYLIVKGVNVQSVAIWLNVLCLLSFLLLLFLGLVYCRKTAKKISQPLVELSEMVPLINENSTILFNENTKVNEINHLSKKLNISSTAIVNNAAEKRKYANNTSHELRTPLMKIKGYAEGMQYDVIDCKEAAQIIIEQSDKLTKLLEAALEKSRLENNKYMFEKADITQKLQKIIDTYKGVRISKNININFKYEKQMMVYLSYELLENVANNIITNAFRYCKQNIDIEVFEQEGFCVCIIKDDGDGIYDIENCFNRFEKGEDGNFGLGLNIAYEAMKLMNGSIEVENDNGAKFTIKIPLASNLYKK